MNISMPIRYGMFVARFAALAEEHERLARFEVLVRPVPGRELLATPSF
jgi:hypothetical protein